MHLSGMVAVIFMSKDARFRFKNMNKGLKRDLQLFFRKSSATSLG